ncbi:hypothetical protein RhiirA1_406311 [Rhizophagus irregularis]|uniref:RING-type domain-containing protein n=6 Tax=Rhizophagus irregularis TaxID=588596 RepID=A0A2I1E3M8_9GLOM|nr:hypothetical protein GLOIN_2v1786082 [Rhizophagus irregularis DAOM 181602=DAOM 197198]EXX73463.1 hypothetical protein RirG_060260 [Rhizophagus irregularis DAOM 197198w]PKC76437.1 hypothetical protein RhiirA1_406311 [Rhizophagus irregularis]PKK79620.1 hypothetical protein RhiirC2_726716 [Rhizophagus irregularis]PKY16699.1 hypothetical protein RhiirB3_403216 [Rhizophagus irregularis]POG61856.1 hypothetical protein GLOIN_2v1786082 [Rhizophagus irregularis DAOM 181602=DAOM 197198]|eukprot:XP_025168722.1 hypothetical protein GLOIN_2v1786082 [Rhizophagus irregularis DAOM 181602=DAOM 197198]
MDNDSNDATTSTTPVSRGQQRSAVFTSVLSSGPASSLATTSVRATASNSRQVRQNWWGYIVENFRSISRTSKVLLILNLTMVLIQVVVTITVLVISRHQECDKPLRLFLILYIARVIVACPVNVYLYLNPRENRRGGQNPNENENQRRDGWVDRLKSFLDLFATLWFIIGNYLLFTTVKCQSTSPPVFYLSLTWVIVGYIIITIPILLCLAVIFCLPCVLVAMRMLNVSEATGMSGAKDDIIQKIPLVKYKASVEESTDTVITMPPQTSSMTPSNDETQPPRQDQPRKKSRFKQLFGSNRKGSSTSSAPTVSPPFPIPNSDDAVCSICLEPYEDGVELRRLWCSHHFHKECVDEWLKLNKKCPMCREDVEEMAAEHSSKKGKTTITNTNNNNTAGEGSSTNTTGQVNIKP